MRSWCPSALWRCASCEGRRAVLRGWVAEQSRAARWAALSGGERRAGARSKDEDGIGAGWMWRETKLLLMPPHTWPQGSAGATDGRSLALLLAGVLRAPLPRPRTRLRTGGVSGGRAQWRREKRRPAPSHAAVSGGPGAACPLANCTLVAPRFSRLQVRTTICCAEAEQRPYTYRGGAADAGGTRMHLATPAALLAVYPWVRWAAVAPPRLSVRSAAPQALRCSVEPQLPRCRRVRSE